MQHPHKNQNSPCEKSESLTHTIYSLFSSPGYLSLMFLGIIFSIIMFHTMILHPDTIQILDKAYKFISLGEWTHYGNKATGAGYIPGTLLTAVTALPMKLYLSPYSPFLGIVLSHLASLILLIQVGNKIFPKHLQQTCWLLLLALFWLNPWRVEQSELYNPAYVFFFSSLHLWTAMKMTRPSFSMTFLHVISIGFCFQFHYSVLILGLTTLFLLYTKQIRFHTIGFIFGALTTVATLVPWILLVLSNSDEKLAGGSNGFSLGKNLIYIYPILKAVLYWIRFGSTHFAKFIFNEISFTWISTKWVQFLVYYLFHVSKWIVAIITLYYSYQLNKRILRKTLRLKPFTQNQGAKIYSNLQRFHFYYFALFISMLASCSLSSVVFQHWHLIICFPAIALFMTRQLVALWKKSMMKRSKAPLWGLIMFFALINIFASIESKFHSYKNNYHRSVLEYYKEKSIK